jgi:hypothetical protein
MLDSLEILYNILAANTTKILLGTSIIDMIFHNSVILAKRFAFLDIFSRTFQDMEFAGSKMKI